MLPFVCRYIIITIYDRYYSYYSYYRYCCVYQSTTTTALIVVGGGPGHFGQSYTKYYFASAQLPRTESVHMA